MVFSCSLIAVVFVHIRNYHLFAFGVVTIPITKLCQNTSADHRHMAVDMDSQTYIFDDVVQCQEQMLKHSFLLVHITSRQ